MANNCLPSAKRGQPFQPRKLSEEPDSESEIISNAEFNWYPSKELKKAIDEFNDDGNIGEGASSVVYKARINEERKIAAEPGSPGTIVAVKTLDIKKQSNKKQWIREIKLWSKIDHPSLVRFIGCSYKDTTRMIIYEYMENGTLHHHLFDGNRPLSWGERLNIAIDVADGLAFLHSLSRPVLWRDAKSANILLDKNYKAKLSDFGLAKQSLVRGEPIGHSNAAGTFGYAPPEYILTNGRSLSTKTDVFSFGVVLLEILTGQRAIESSQSLTLFARAQIIFGDPMKLTDVMDPKLKGKYPRKAAFALSFVAWKCVSAVMVERPSMAEVYELLLKIRDETDTM